jgi:predicted nucleic acid-binding protein
MQLAASYLLDTNVLLRLSKPTNPEFHLLRAVLRVFQGNKTQLFYTSQNLIEFWNVLTRPADRNGYGLSVAEADKETKRLERSLLLLPSMDAIHKEWRRIVVAYGVSGVQVHDAHLVAAMNVHGVSHLLTLNTRDFTRYREITVVHPSHVPV